MIDLETLRLLKHMSRYLKHRDGCCDSPGRVPRGFSEHYFSDDRMPKECNCGLQMLRRSLRRLLDAEVASVEPTA